LHHHITPRVSNQATFNQATNGEKACNKQSFELSDGLPICAVSTNLARTSKSRTVRDMTCSTVAVSAMPPSDEDKKLIVPKFSSFKPKEPAPSSRSQSERPKDEDRDHHKRSHRTGKRHDHHSRHHHHHSHRRDEPHRTDERRSFQPHEDGRRRQDSKSLPGGNSVSSVPGLFVMDKKGDPLIRKYGIDRSKIPAYYRYGGGKVLGTDGRLVIHRDGPRDTFSLRFPGEGSSAGSRTKDGLRSTCWQRGQPVRLRARKDEPAGDDPGNYLSLENPRKRNRGQRDSDSSEGDDQPSWRSIEGKAKPVKFLGNDTGDSDDQVEELVKADGDDPLKWKSIQLNRQVKDHPDDIDGWLELADHQDALLRAGETIDQRATENAAHSFVEIKVHMLESALPHATRPGDRRRVLVSLMREGVKVWNSKTAAKKWLQVLEDERHDFGLWKTHLDFSMSNIATVRYQEVKKMLLDRLQQAVSRSGLQSRDDLEEAIYVFLRATRFVHDAGYKELAVAAWQGLLELTFFRPKRDQNQKEAFRDFWESEVPRMGDADAQGWRHYVECGGSGDAPESLTSNEIEDASSRDAFEAWRDAEAFQERHANMPARTLDDGTDDDPFKVVMYSDIEPLLFFIPEHALPDITEQLIDAFLIFCGLPPAFRSSDWTEQAHHDQFLSGHDSGVYLQPAWEGDEGASEDLQRKPPSFTSAKGHARMSPSLLFSGSGWFTYLAVLRPGHAVDVPWVETTLKQLVHSADISGLAQYYLAVCFAREPATIRKPAKAVLKRYPTNTRLYNAYALAEFANGNFEIANKVLAAATVDPSLGSTSTWFVLFQTWSWMELEKGDKHMATRRLCASVEDSLRKPQIGDVRMSPSLVLIARQAFSSRAQQCLYEGRVDDASNYMECLTLLSYLTSTGGGEPTSASQGNLSAAMGVIESMSNEFRSRGYGSEAAHERILQFACRVLYWNATKGPFRRAYVREQLSRFIDLFPRNTMFLSLFEWADASIRVVDETRQLLYDRVLVKAHDSVGCRVLAIQHELARGNANSTQAAFEHALSSDGCKSSVLLWVSYIRFCHSQKHLRAKSKGVFYRALNHCPWSKGVMMEAFATLIRDMKSEELKSVFATMASKGLRIHVDMDEFMEKGREERQAADKALFVSARIYSTIAMVDQRPDALCQAGGGASESMRSIQTLNDKVLPYLRRVFESHAGPDQKWTKTQVKAFVHRVQDNDDATPAATHLLDQPDIDFNRFLGYMTSPDSAITMPWKECDLSWPLASYYISSSHNTYLTGNQLSSDSTTGAYTDALLRGCRCVEVDVWDGDESDAESTASSVSGDEGKGSGHEKPKAKRKSKFSMLKERLPDSLVSKLEKTILGRKMEYRDADMNRAVAAVKEDAGEELDEAIEGLEIAMVEPRVLHGHTLTKEVSFRSVCKAIRKSAFAVTDLPLIISLEVHCNPQQQAVMVSIMKEAWEGLLVTESESKAGSLPSPHDLRGKILIKVKYVPPDTELDETESGEDDRAGADAAKQTKSSRIIQDLSRLGIYTQAVSFKAWTQPEASMPAHVFSLSENKFLDHVEKHGADLFQHNVHYLMRAYPSVLRIGSSNLSPPVFWGSGTQMVALNWQQTDEGMMLNEGMFAGTDYRPGIQPKPEQSTSTARNTLSLAITFLAAQSIPLPHQDSSPKRFNPYVKTEIHVDGSNHLLPVNSGHGHADEYKARTRTHHGCDVDFSGETVSFGAMAGLVEELTFVRFTLRDDEIGRDELAAWACVRLDRLGQGYRFIHLMDSKGALTEGVILVKVEKTLA
ncbi:Protein NRDE2-like protein, partial [Tolypocladium capitatum]